MWERTLDRSSMASAEREANHSEGLSVNDAEHSLLAVTMSSIY